MTNAFVFNIKWPLDDKKVEVRIESKTYHYFKIYRPNDFLNLSTVFEVLNYPNRIFLGLRRRHSNSKNKLCIVGKPKNWYIGKDSNSLVPFPPDLVYLVFLNERNSIFEFRAEKADTEDSLSPVDWKNRFSKRIWKKNS